MSRLPILTLALFLAAAAFSGKTRETPRNQTHHWTIPKCQLRVRRNVTPSYSYRFPDFGRKGHLFSFHDSSSRKIRGILHIFERDHISHLPHFRDQIISTLPPCVLYLQNAPPLSLTSLEILWWNLSSLRSDLFFKKTAVCYHLIYLVFSNDAVAAHVASQTKCYSLCMHAYTYSWGC